MTNPEPKPYFCDGCKRYRDLNDNPPHFVSAWNSGNTIKEKLLCPNCFKEEQDLKK